MHKKLPIYFTLSIFLTTTPSVYSSEVDVSLEKKNTKKIVSDKIEALAAGGMALGAQENIFELLIAAKTFAIEANSDLNDPATLGLINDDYQAALRQVDYIAETTRWEGTPLLNREAGLQITSKEASDPLHMDGSTTSILGLTGTDVCSAGNAALAGPVLGNAIIRVNRSIVKLWGQLQQLKSTLVNRPTSNKNNNESNSGIAKMMGVKVGVLKQADHNVKEGLETLNMIIDTQKNIFELLRTMKSQTEEINGAYSAEDFYALGSDYQVNLYDIDRIANSARWKSKSIFNGGAGGVYVAQEKSLTASGMNADPDANLTFDETRSSGFISGDVRDVLVEENGDNYYDIWVGMDLPTPRGSMHQTFEGIAAAPTNSHNLTEIILKSTTDPNNLLVFRNSNTGAVTMATQFEADLKTVLDLGPGLFGAKIESKATAVNNGIASNSDITAESTTPPGSYALTYNSKTKLMKLTTGAETFEEIMSCDGAQTVLFKNGVRVALDSTFSLTKNITQIVFNVETSSDAVCLNIQVGEQSDDIFTIFVAGATASVLGLTGTNVASVFNAASAGILLDAAIQTMESAIKKSSAQQMQLKFTSKNLQASIKSIEEALSFYDK